MKTSELAKELGYKTIPCVYVNIPDIKKEQELNLRLNKNVGSWDYDLLANFSEDELNKAGFESEELDKIFNLEASEDDFDAEAEYEKIKEPKAKLGELYQLGSHKLLCGDSIKKEDVEKLMGGNKADMVFTDPPYGVNVGQKLGNRNIIGDDNIETMKGVVKPTFINIANNIKIGASYYICSPQGGDQELMMMMMRDSGIKCRHQIIWKKNVAVFSMGRLDYSYIHECILYGWKDKHNFYGKNENSVWEIDRPKSSKEHPTQKPLELCSRAIKNSSKREDIVLDLFGGSGSTLIACEQLNRKCYMCEIDPVYIQVIINRWEKLTQKKAKLIQK